MQVLCEYAFELADGASMVVEPLAPKLGIAERKMNHLEEQQGSQPWLLTKLAVINKQSANMI
jgi:hypothetical protein